MKPYLSDYKVSIVLKFSPCLESFDSVTVKMAVVTWHSNKTDFCNCELNLAHLATHICPPLETILGTQIWCSIQLFQTHVPFFSFAISLIACRSLHLSCFDGRKSREHLLCWDLNLKCSIRYTVKSSTHMLC